MNLQFHCTFKTQHVWLAAPDTNSHMTCSIDTDSRVTCSKKLTNCVQLQGSPMTPIHSCELGNSCSCALITNGNKLVIFSGIALYYEDTCVIIGYFDWKFYVSDAVAVVTSTTFGSGTGAIFLDNVTCRGNETNLDDCPHIGVGIHNCIHSEDAGVICSPGQLCAVCLLR